MSMSPRFACRALFALVGLGGGAAFPVFAAAPAETYIVDDHSSGSLDLWRKPGASGLDGARFRINTVSSRGNLCDLEGIVSGKRAVLKEAGETCVVDFEAKGDAISIETKTGEACAHYCGVGAYFTGNYLKQPAICSDAARKKANQQFLQHYRAGRYEPALKILLPVLETCQPTLFWLDEMSLRNDLAVTYAHLERKEACRRALQPYQSTIEGKGEDEDVGPMLSESYAKQLKNARHNWQMCR